jgi:hypothetical protein
MFQGVCIQTPMMTNQTKVTGMKIFQPKRMIWLVIIGVWMQTPWNIWN